MTETTLNPTLPAMAREASLPLQTEASPWAGDAATTLPQPAPFIDPWQASMQAGDGGAASTDWLNTSATPVDMAAALDPSVTSGLPLTQLFDGSVPVQAWINQGLGWVVEHFRPFFQSVRAPIDGTLSGVEGLLTSLPAPAMVVLAGLLAWQFAGRALALGTVVSLALVALLGIWPEAMVTLSLVLTSLAFCVLIGLPLTQLFDGSVPVQAGINQGLGWVVEHFRPFFQSVRAPIDGTLGGVEGLLLSVPTLAMVALLGLLAWQFAGRALAVGTVLSLMVVALLGIWPEAMVTLSLVLTSLAFCVLIGLPLGIVLASSDRAQRVMRPLLDAMQTTPAFVYLVPVVMLFGIGNVPGVIVTIVFALPPLIRLTNLGIRQVRPDLIEASRAYGASPWQLLWKVQLPLAMPSIMAGINQALMLSLSMVVIASMIAVGGLGQMVLRGIGRLDMGLATVGGLGIVLLAIVLDRITQAMGEPSRGGARWWHTGPAGLVTRRLAGRASQASAPAPVKPVSAPQAQKPAVKIAKTA